MAEFSFEEISVFLPKYLSPSKQQGLFDELKRFPDKVSYYTPVATLGEDEFLQGDGWRGLIAIDFDTLEKKAVSGVIISNSCDIAVANKHDHMPNVLFAPIVRLSGFLDILRGAGSTDGDIEKKTAVIRRQSISSMFYLPSCANVIDESIIVLDDVHRHPLKHFVGSPRTRLFRLTQFAFYLFIIKLSIHFHRINEGVERFIPPAAESV